MATKNNNELAVIEKKLNPIAMRAQRIVINSPETLKEAVEMLSELNRANDTIAEQKDKIYKPAYAAVVAIRKMWKPLETVFETEIASLRKKMTAYQTAQVAKADAKAEKIADRVSRGTLKAETGIAKLDEIETPDKEVATEEGLVQFREVKRFEVEDKMALAKHSLDLVLPNEALIRALMKEGKEVPGVRYYTEQVPANYR